MKTKFLFYSLAVAAAMASCTQEAIEAPVDNVQQDLSVRPTLGEVVLTDDADLTSRFAIGTYKAKFEDGDKLGAAIMDKPLYPATPYNEEYPAANYEVVEYYSSNAAFTRENGAWRLTDDQPLVEGNYLFYAPYKQSALRSTFEVRTPQRQNASTDKSALEEYYASGAMVKIGHQFLASEGGKAQKPVVNMYDVMSYPMFTIVNNFDGYTVQTFKNEKGEVVAKDSLVEYTGAIKVDSIQFAFADKKEANKGEGFVIGGLLANKEGVEANLTERKHYYGGKGEWYLSPLNTYTADLLNSKATIKTDSIITTLVAGGREIEKGDTATFYAVLPAGQFEEGQLQANVYVTIGEKPYVISTANVRVEEVENEDKTKTSWDNVLNNDIDGVVPGHTYTSTSGTITLIQGYRFPQEEMDEDNGQMSAKIIAGRALRLVLAGGKADAEKGYQLLQVAKEVPVGTVEEGTATTTDLIDNNEEFIQFFKDMESASALTESIGTDKEYKDNDKDNDYVIDYDKAQFAFSENTTATINAELIKALAKHTYGGSIQINKALVIANDVKVTNVNGKKVSFLTADKTASYDITLGTEYTTDNNVVVSIDKSVHVKSGANWNVPASFTTGNVRNDGTMNVATVLTVTTMVNNGALNANASCNIINKFVNSGTINVNDEGAVLKVEGYGKLKVDASVTNTNNFKYVVDEGGNQTGVYNLDKLPTASTGLTKIETGAVAAEKIAWVNELTLNNNLDFGKQPNLLSKLEDIKTLNVSNVKVSFNDVKTFDMNGLTLNFDGAVTTVSGKSLSQSIVKNVIIKSTGGRVELANIAANGEFSGWGELYADGVNATWNGETVGVIALEKDEVNKVYTVNTLVGLNEFAEIVNDGNSLTGYTVKLANDIDMFNKEWEPVGNLTNLFAGTFDGNGKTIYNLRIESSDAYAALFGAVSGTIENLKIDGAYVSGNHFVAALAGQALYGANIENCEVNNATIICTWKNVDDSGDKAGAIVGMLGSSSTNNDGTIKKCKASNSTVSASRDAGQIVGAANPDSVTECTVENVEVSANGTGKDEATGDAYNKIGTNVNDEQVGRKF